MTKRVKTTESTTSVTTYLGCPKQYWFRYHSEEKAKNDYPRFLGKQVHQLVYRMYDSKRYPLGFYDMETLRRYWYGSWIRALDKASPPLTERANNHDYAFASIGWLCLRNYWIQNVTKPPPLGREQRYSWRFMPGMDFVGVLDQTRSISLEGIQKIRPELIKNGELVNGYDPVILVDLKTSKKTYKKEGIDKIVDPLEMALFQSPLHQDFQATSYYWLYNQVHKKMPIAFYWYHLRDGKAFMTYRTKEDFDSFSETLKHVVNGINMESFPKNPGKHCLFCDYNIPCQQLNKSRPMAYVEPADGLESGTIHRIWPKETPYTKWRQLKINFNRKSQY